MRYKKCTACKKRKPLTDFYKQKQTSDGLRYSCKDCLNFYSVWNNMLDRCNNVKHKDYKNYGGRGIKVYKEWLKENDGFPVFKQWALANGRKSGLTLERVNNNKGYNPDNCIFTTCAINNQNQRSTKLNPEKVRYIRKAHEQGKPLVRLAEKFGVSLPLISLIVARKIWKNI